MSANRWEDQTNDWLQHILFSDAAFTRAECLSIVEKYATQEHKEGKVGLGEAGKKLRNSKIVWLRREPSTLWIYTRMETLFQHANQRYRFDIRGWLDSIQFAQYGVGEHYDWHVDLGVKITSLRKISVSIQLSDSDDYDGGDLEFFNSTITTPRKMGLAVAFPSYFPHRVAEVTRGSRHSLVAWASGPAFR